MQKLDSRLQNIAHVYTAVITGVMMCASLSTFVHAVLRDMVVSNSMNIVLVSVLPTFIAVVTMLSTLHFLDSREEPPTALALVVCGIINSAAILLVMWLANLVFFKL